MKTEKDLGPCVVGLYGDLSSQFDMFGAVVKFISILTDRHRNVDIRLKITAYNKEAALIRHWRRQLERGSKTKIGVRIIGLTNDSLILYRMMPISFTKQYLTLRAYPAEHGDVWMIKDEGYRVKIDPGPPLMYAIKRIKK